MADRASAALGSRVQLIVDALAQSLDRAVLLDDVSLTLITHSRQRGQLDDVPPTLRPTTDWTPRIVNSLLRWAAGNSRLDEFEAGNPLASKTAVLRVVQHSENCW